jgi:CRISPR-associated protein Cas1
VSDVFKFDTVVPVAFRIAAKNPHNAEQQVRLGCRDAFRETRLLERIIPTIEEMLAAGEITPPIAPEESVAIAIPNPKSLGDVGHRS